MGEDAVAVSDFLTPARRRSLHSLPPLHSIAGLGDDLICLLPGRLNAGQLENTIMQVRALREAFAADA